MIAILCVITCALCVMLTACTLIGMNGGDNNNGSENGGDNNNGSENSNQIVDFNAITENDWKGEQLTEEQWKKAFDSSNFENVTVFTGWYDNTTKSYYSTGANYLELNSKRVEQHALPEGMGHPEQIYKIYEKNNKGYGFASIVDERKTTDRNHVEYLWLDAGEFMSLEELNDMKSLWSYSELKDKLSDFEYKDGIYYAEKVVLEPDGDEVSFKLSFKDEKIFMLSKLSHDGERVYAYRNYGKTTVSIPQNEDVVDANNYDSPADYDCLVYNRKHVDANNNDFCDICWQPTCKEHVDNDKDGDCDWCWDCMKHVDEDKDGKCDNCHDCIEHVDEDKDGYCDNCPKCLKHVDENKDGDCDNCDRYMSDNTY